MLHYALQQVSSSTLLIIRRNNCIATASGIVTLEIGEQSYINKMRSAVLLKQYWDKKNSEVKLLWLVKWVPLNLLNAAMKTFALS